MTKFAIINGDDFGISQEVNKAIIQAHTQGILTSASLMVTGAASAEAVKLAHNYPNLGVGLHLVLVCGKSVLSFQEIPNLVNENCLFPADAFQAGLRYYFNRQAREELRREIGAQLQKFRETGLKLTHVDGHLHLHSHPVILQILTEFAEEFNIKFIRLPLEELSLTLKIDKSNLITKLVWSFVFTQLRNYGEKLLQSKGIKYAERVYGLLQTGKITEEYLLELIPQIKANLIEIYAHPDLKGEGNLELEALLSKKVKDVLSEFELINYNSV